MTPDQFASDKPPITPPEDPGDDYETDDESSGPSKVEQWQEMAARGDLNSLLRETSSPLVSRLCLNLLSGLIHETIERLARSSPMAFAEFLRSEMLASVAKMLMRAHHLLDRELRGQSTDQTLWADRPGLRELSDRVVALDAEVTKLLHVSASTQLLLERARKLKLANDKAEARQNRPRRPRRQRISRTPPVAASTRLGGDLP